MTDEELFELVKRVDPQAVRLPPGIKAIATEIAEAERERWARVLAEVLHEAEGWLDEARGCKPCDLIDYTGWAERARALLWPNHT